MIIRKSTIDDAEKFLEYLETFWKDGCDTVVGRMISLPDLEHERNWLSKMTGEDAVVYVAETEGKIIGMIQANVPGAAEFRHTCEIGMSVLLQYRNRGIGKKLIQQALEWAHEKRLCIIELEVFSNNRPAISLYSNTGFVEDGRRLNAVRLKDGTYCDLVHMSKFTEFAGEVFKHPVLPADSQPEN